MSNFLMALRYSEPFLPGLEEKYEHEIILPKQQPEESVSGFRYFEPVIKLVGDAKTKIERTRDYEKKKRMAQTSVIYVRKHKNQDQLEREYKKELEKALLTNDIILIEPHVLCKYVSRTIKFGFYFFLLCLGLSFGSVFIGRCYKHKTYLATSLFVSGALLTILYSKTYETWAIADFKMLPDALLCGVYCSPAVIFKTENPVAIFRIYDRLERVQFLYIVAAVAGLQILYRLYTGLPPYLCPCSAREIPEFPRYASLLFFPVISCFNYCWKNDFLK